MYLTFSLHLCLTVRRTTYVSHQPETIWLHATEISVDNPTQKEKNHINISMFFNCVTSYITIMCGKKLIGYNKPRFCS